MGLGAPQRIRRPGRTGGRDDLAEIIFTSGATADPKGVIITHRNILANIVPVEGEVRKYRRYGAPFFPLRFLNLLPLSHMFGQAMATFIPPMLPGVVVFMRGFSPDEILRQIHGRRISVLVSVPKILEILREHVMRAVPRSRHGSRGRQDSLAAPLVALPPRPSPVRLEVLGVRRGRRAACRRMLEEFWSRLGYIVIQGYGLTETAPIVTLNHPFHARKGTVGNAHRRRRSEDRRRRRDPGARRERHARATTEQTSRSRFRRRLAAHRRHRRNSTPRAGCRFGAARKK